MNSTSIQRLLCALWACLPLLALSTASAQQTAQVSGLRCEGLVNPLGVDTRQPALSWRIASKRRGERQTAYQVLVASSPERLARNEGDLWSTGKVATDQSQCVPYAGRPLQARTRCCWKVRVWDGRGRASGWSRPAEWTMGLLAPEDWQAKWIQLPNTDPDVAPWLRKAFTLSAAPTRALVSVNAVGYFELYVNGRKVGRDVLTPAVSALEKRSFIVTYDAAPLLRKGRNAIGLWLGRGWAPAAPLVRAQLDMQTAGGERLRLATDATWKGLASPYRRIGKWSWGNFGGEHVDARADVPGWCAPEFDDRPWANAAEVAAPAGKPEAQMAPLNRIGKVIRAVAVTPAGANRYEIDFGTALSGWLRLKLPRLAAGTVVKMTFADLRKGTEYQTFNQASEFVSAGGGGEVFENKFNYAGFRYVIVEGLPAAPAREDATALLIESDLEPAGTFECSNDLFNRIHQLTQWTQRCLDLGAYYVDCPHRERMGYGDGQVAAEGFLTSFRADQFYRKWLCDWRLLQRPNGSMPNSAPFGQGGGGPAWAGLLGAITWRHYQYYGDRRILEENYDALRRYAEWLEAQCKENVLRKYGGQWDFIGDWVPPGRGMDTNNWPGKEAAELFNNCYRVYQWETLAKMAAALGRQEDAAQYRARLDAMRPAIHASFYDAANQRYGIDEQAYYVMPLLTGVTPEAEREAVLRNLEVCILVKRQGHLDTGMLGTYFLMEYLRSIRRDDLAFTIFSRTTRPGWGYMLDKGGTTCWEQWNGYYSHIHSCFTSADNWLYQGPGGIRPDPAGPGFRRVLIEPAVAGDLAWVKCSHQSPYGEVACDWKRDAGALALDVTVPANTSATVRVPTPQPDRVREGGRPVARAEGIKVIGREASALLLEVGSGRYHFTAPAPPVVVPQVPGSAGPTGGSFADPLRTPDDAWQAVSGKWGVEAGELVVRGTGAYALNGRAWRDAAYRVRLRLLGNDRNPLNWGGLRFRMDAPEDGHSQSGYLAFFRTNGKLALFRTGTTLREVDTGLDPTQPVLLRVETAGERIRVFLNKETTPRIDVTDDAFASGYAGISTWGANAAFSEFAVTPPQQPK